MLCTPVFTQGGSGALLTPFILVSLTVWACSDAPTSTTPLVLVPRLAMVGDTSCGGANEWSEDSGHAEDSSTYLVSPTVCWEWPGGAQVFVKFKYQLKHNFDGVNYHMMQYYQRDWRCGTPIQAESHTTEASQLRTIDTNPESLQATITLPNSPGCAFVSLQVDSPLSAVSDHLVYVRILTGLDDQPPESLEASLSTIV